MEVLCGGEVQGLIFFGARSIYALTPCCLGSVDLLVVGIDAGRRGTEVRVVWCSTSKREFPARLCQSQLLRRLTQEVQIVSMFCWKEMEQMYPSIL
jgi:hypothetical protein